MTQAQRFLLSLVSILVTVGLSLSCTQSNQVGDWRSYGSDLASTKYSPVPSINSSCMRLANFLQPECFGRLHVGRFKSLCIINIRPLLKSRTYAPFTPRPTSASPA